METPKKRETLKKMINGEPADLKSMVIVCHRNEGKLMRGDKPVSEQFINRFCSLLVEARSKADAEEIQGALDKLDQMEEYGT
jgi:hypothetical protein